MLIAKIYINVREIDDIHILNTGKMDGDKYVYRVMNPGVGEVLTETTISHKRSDGYRKLLIKVLELMEKEDIPNAPHIPIFAKKIMTK